MFLKRYRELHDRIESLRYNIYYPKISNRTKVEINGKHESIKAAERK